MKKVNENIILIGMPGSGKTSIGRLVADELSMEFCDIDEYIEKKEGRSIPDIFQNDGEEYFRKLESESVEEVSRYTDSVISTGGGVIKFHKNMEFLNESGIIIFVNRALDNIISDIQTHGRPLLKDGKERLYKLYNERIDLYKKYCNYEIINDGSIEDVVERIIEIVKNIYC
ncbi:MAG: shikimate kinase [Maledivibacter sp.]|jgi:shikimate kinase|nr:shikimate kinase [Maledivibacter sp.]